MRDAGSTLVEALVSLVLTLVATTAALSLLNPHHLAAQVQAEALDMHQRLRVALDVLTRDLSAASQVRSTADNAISIALPAVGTTTPSETRSFYLDAAGNQLRQFDGQSTDVPVADNVVGLTFEYFGDSAVAGGELTPLGRPAGADLGRIRAIRATVRVQAAQIAFRAAGSAFARPGTARDSRRALADMSVSVRIGARNLGLPR